MAVYVKPLLHGNMLMLSVREATIAREHVDGSVREPLLHGNMLMAAYMKPLLQHVDGRC